MVIWMVRCEGGTLYQKFVNAGAVAIDGPELGSIQELNSREAIKKKVAETWSDRTVRWHSHATGVLYRFKTGIEVGDYVVTYDKKQRIYALGRVKSEYKYNVSFDANKTHIRDVKWHAEFLRDDLSVATRSKLGSRHTVYRINDKATAEILAIAGNPYE